MFADQSQVKICMGANILVQVKTCHFALANPWRSMSSHNHFLHHPKLDPGPREVFLSALPMAWRATILLGQMFPQFLWCQIQWQWSSQLLQWWQPRCHGWAIVSKRPSQRRRGWQLKAAFWSLWKCPKLNFGAFYMLAQTGFRMQFYQGSFRRSN